MTVGIIGVGTVGGTLKRWFEEHTNHLVKCVDPAKGMNDSLEGCQAIFISIPVTAGGNGQYLQDLAEVVSTAKQHTDNVFIRSTVLPGTNDKLDTISMPEFLTARTAYDDMCKLPIIVGKNYSSWDREFIDQLFPGKEKIYVTNTEAELAKFTHNCFGALKVTYFNMMYRLSKEFGANFDQVKKAAFVTGFIEPQHTQVPGHDGKFGFGGACFPENMQALENMLWDRFSHDEFVFINKANEMNKRYREMV